MKIYPINTKAKTFINYTNYLNWLDYSIQSIQNYIDYFNPDFRVHGQNLNYVNIISKEERSEALDIIAFKDDVYLDKNGNIPDPEDDNPDDLTQIKYCEPGDFSFREGIFINEGNVYIKLNDETYKPLEISSFVFPKANARGINITGHPDRVTLNDFIQIAAPQAAMYQVQYIDQKLVFTYVKDGHRLFRGGLLFSIETKPGRYYLTNQDNTKWSGEQWIKHSAFKEPGDNNITLNIVNQDGQVWTNAYPIMHELYIKTEVGENTNQYLYEDFFMDNSFKAELLKAGDLGAMSYTIYGEDLNDNLNDDIYVSIF